MWVNTVRWKHGSWIVCWHRGIVLAHHQKPDGQLAISSRQAEAYRSAIVHTLHFCFPPSFAPSLLACPSPTPVTTHSFAYPSEGPAPPRGPVKARWHSQFVSVSVVSMLAYVCSFPDNQPPALIKTCWNVPGISRIHSSSHRNTHPLALNITRLLKFKHETAVTFDGLWGGWCGGKTRHRSCLVGLFILLKKKNVHFLYISDCIFPNAQQQSAVPFQSGPGDKSHRNCPGALNP